MIPSREVKFNRKEFTYRIENEYHLCDSCDDIYAALRRNKKTVLKNLKINNTANCYCKEDFDDEVKICVFKNKRKVGTLTLQAINKNTYETHSHLARSLHRKKIGIWMYALGVDWCKQNGFKLKSSDGYSDEAGRLWESKTLRKYYTVTKTKSKAYWQIPRYSIAPKTNTALAKFNKNSMYDKRLSRLQLRLLAA